MKKLSQAIALAGVVTAGVAVVPAVQAEVSFNVAAASNYVWRGTTQTNDNSAVQGGVDYEHASGFAAGVWTSNLEGDTEVDYYASFSGEAGAVSYTAGVISYDYNNDTDDFVEVYAGLGVADASLTYYKKVNDGNDDKSDDDAAYVSLGYGLGLTDDLALDFAAGQTIDVNDKDSKADKYDLALSLTKSLPEFDFTITATDKEDGENEMFISVAKSF